MEKLNNGRAKIETKGTRTNIKIPVKRSFLMIIFLSVWLLIWFSFMSSFSSTFAIYTDEGINSFSLTWITLWFLGGLVVLILLLWNLLGTESILINSECIEVNRSLFGIGRRKKYDIKHINNFRFNQIPDYLFSMKNSLAFWLGEGKVKFDYGMKSPSFGFGLEDAEANYIVKLMQEKTTNNR